MSDLDLIGTWEKPLAVITGAAGGMGRAIARRLGARYRLAVVDVSRAAVDPLAETLTEEGYDVALAAVADVSDRGSVDALVASVAEAGRVGTVVHTAGVSPSLADWATILRVNLTGTVHVLDAFLPLAQPGSSVVCFASTAAYTFPTSPMIDAILDEPAADDLAARLEPLLRALPGADDPLVFGTFVYGASKLGVKRLVERRVNEWAEQGSRIVSVSPGLIVTPMGRSERASNPRAAATASITPLRRLGMPTDLASAIDFLTSDLASYVTGTDLRVDGGIVPARLREG